jgi:WD40 repeat protein
LIFLLVSSLVSAEPDSLIELQLIDTLSSTDLGILAGEVSPDGILVLLVGKDGYVYRISAPNPEDRSKDIEINTGRIVDLTDVTWHPRGETALLVGDFGVALRYSIENHAITTVNGTGSLLGLDMTAVDWRPAGDYAYLGASDGSVWKFSEGSGMVAIEQTRSSEITDIACHRNQNICVVATLTDGLAVLSSNHEMTYLPGTAAQTWVGVDCAEPTLNECVGFASGMRMKAIRIDTIDASKSTTEETYGLDTLEGDFTGVSRGYDGSTIVHLSPFATIRQQPLISQAFSQITTDDALEWDAVIAGRSIEMVWETEEKRGFMVTSFGNIISFVPIGEVVEMDLMSIVVMAAVTVSVPGVVIGLIYMNSPYLQSKYMKWRGRKNK